MTLKRRRNRLELEAKSSSKRTLGSEYAENELDELIAVLKTGDYMSNRKMRSSSHRKLEVNRNRPISMIDGSFHEEKN